MLAGSKQLARFIPPRTTQFPVSHPPGVNLDHGFFASFSFVSLDIGGGSFILGLSFILFEGLFIMTHDSQLPPVFRIDVSAEHASTPETESTGNDDSMVQLLREMITLQEQQNQLLEDLNMQLVTTQRQRANELGMWKEAHPDLARNCRLAAETLSRVQTQFLHNLTEEVEHNEDALIDGEFMLNEFVDRYGPRLAHLNGVLQVLSQLSGDQATSNSSV